MDPDSLLVGTEKSDSRDHADNSLEAATTLVEQLLEGYQGQLSVQLWDESRVVGSVDSPCTLKITAPSVLKRLITSRSLETLVEDYLEGRLKVLGDLGALFDAAPHFEHLRLGLAKKLQLMRHAMKLPGESHWRQGQASRANNSTRSIQSHYDVGNDFYRLWLDPQMIYSCAYFRDQDQSLTSAQEDKLDHICRKLMLEPGDRLLDIGCGWGGLARWTAKHYGAKVLGITLSRQQCEYAKARVESEGLEEQVDIRLMDYRDLPERAEFDRVVSVGMFEHIGLNNFPGYFSKVAGVLKPGGLFLNHGITSDHRWHKTPLTSFINRYIFPDGELTRISEVVDAMESAGWEILDVEGMRRHYAQTLRHWVQALEDHEAEAVETAGEKTFRLWRLYMAGCAHYFDEGSIGIYQVQAVRRRDADFQQPWRRSYLYTPAAQQEGRS